MVRRRAIKKPPGEKEAPESGGNPWLFHVHTKEQEPIFPQFPLSGTLDKILQKEIDRVTLLCQQSLKSAVPIRTGELRGNIVTQKSQFDARVGIGTTPHYSGLSNLTLAELLDSASNNFKRSRRSQAVGPFDAIGKRQPTAGWAEKAQNDLRTELE